VATLACSVYGLPDVAGEVPVSGEGVGNLRQESLHVEVIPERKDDDQYGDAAGCTNGQGVLVT
jgi:hypothetical protein